ncbi:MAG: hypothetical protein H0V25_11535 [Solirubrobacterales bacterium]|nr:hypothetical protein [Solirubrobacterales bacterium]
MSSKVLFRCHFCDASPDEETQKTLVGQLTLILFGTYVDADPGNWLTWHGRGIYGTTLYVCGEHRDTLKAYLRKHYGTVGPHPFAEEPHPEAWLRRETLKQTRRRRALMTYRTFDPGR